MIFFIKNLDFVTKYPNIFTQFFDGNFVFEKTVEKRDKLIL